MKNVDSKGLRRRLAESARHAFSEVRRTHPDEAFYAFSLYTVDDAVGISPSACSDQAYARVRSKYVADGAFTEADLLGNFRWSPYDWEYDCAGSEFFGPVNELINYRGSGRYDEMDADGFINFKARVLAAMVLALADLEAEGLFGAGLARRSVTVFCSIAHSDCAAWLEADSARRLNPAEVFEVFSAERVAYIDEGSDALEPGDDNLYAKYLALVRDGEWGD
jgi:hypothetical protein